MLWDAVYLSEQDEAEVAAGTAVVVSPQVVLNFEPWQSLLRSRTGNLPPWVCLDCVPEWSEVHQLAFRDYQWQLEKEAAVLAADFRRAGELMRLQDQDRERIVHLVTHLLREAEAEPGAAPDPAS